MDHICLFSNTCFKILPAEYQGFLEFLSPLLLIILFRLREWYLRKEGYLQAHDNNDENYRCKFCLEKHGFVVEEDGNVAMIAAMEIPKI